MIIGVGTDIVRVARIKKIVEKSETKFIDRILTPKERDKISGLDKQLVGSIASKIKTLRKIEPYKGKGIREKGQYVLKKEGKKK